MLHCSALNFTALDCDVLHFTTLHCTALYNIALNSGVLSELESRSSVLTGETYSYCFEVSFKVQVIAGHSRSKQVIAGVLDFQDYS